MGSMDMYKSSIVSYVGLNEWRKQGTIAPGYIGTYMGVSSDLKGAVTWPSYQLDKSPGKKVYAHGNQRA